MSSRSASDAIARIGEIVALDYATFVLTLGREMDTDPEDSAIILVLCLQARCYSEALAHAPHEAQKVLEGMRKTVRLMARSTDPRMKEVAPQIRRLIDAENADLKRARQG